jgi:NAD(P)-dependent dehydrogenase (short-subunit alcohol dehydrogenase family)
MSNDPSGPATAPGRAGEELRGTVTVVTGVGRPGQAGEVVARRFAEGGVHLVLVERDVTRAERLVDPLQALGVSVHPFGCDLSDAAQTAALAQEVARLNPSGISGLVHLAGGWSGSGPVADLDPDVWRDLISINLTTAFVTSRAFLPLLRTGRGSLVFFGAATALPGASVANSSAYAVAKGGVLTLMRAIAAEERERGVRANALAPQSIRTEENRRTMGDERRHVERETVAEWAWWLCSAASGPVTGQVVRLG